MANQVWYEGKEPDLQKYKLIGTVSGFDVWRRIDNDEDWHNCKLTSKTKRLAKANFWLSWNSSSQRFSNSKDFATLKKHNTKLLDSINIFFSKTYPYHW